MKKISDWKLIKPLLQKYKISRMTIYNLYEKWKNYNSNLNFYDFVISFITPPENHIELGQAVKKVGLPYSRLYYLYNTKEIIGKKVLNKIYLNWDSLNEYLKKEKKDD